MATIGRKDLILLLVGLGSDGTPGDQINGATRLQKLLFLLQEEAPLTPSGEGFEFSPWKAGPYSSKLYDDIEFLENLGLLEAETVAQATEAESLEAAKADDELSTETGFSFDSLMGSQPSEPAIYEEKRFKLSQKGLDRVKSLLHNGALKPVVEGVRKIKSRYAHYSLNDLLYHVYTNYPKMTEASEIRDKVLSRGRR